VITPFTNGYDSILISISLIDDLTEFNRFPDPGHHRDGDAGCQTFTAFDFECPAI
jgi:hypothetical protein